MWIVESSWTHNTTPNFNMTLEWHSAVISKYLLENYVTVMAKFKRDKYNNTFKYVSVAVKLSQLPKSH